MLFNYYDYKKCIKITKKEKNIAILQVLNIPNHSSAFLFVKYTDSIFSYVI
ncbi:hypothetical protein BH23THE1_BH23THE1_25750 [soil metagenome]